MPFTRKRFTTILAATASAVLLTSLAIAPASDAAPLPDHPQKGSRVVDVYFTRHGQTTLNLLGRVQGWIDSPLTDAGRATATTVGTNLGKEIGRVDAVYSGDMMRHYETAELMEQGMHQRLPVIKEEALREMNFGGWEGDTNVNMQTAAIKYLGTTTGLTIPMYAAAIKATNPVPSVPAEDCTDVTARALPALTQIAKDDARGRGTGKVLVVSSGITIACVLDALGTQAPATGISNGAVNLLEYKDGTWTVKSVNDTHYAG